MTIARRSCVLLIAITVVMSAGVAWAQGFVGPAQIDLAPNSISTRIAWDPVTGVPKCTVVYSGNPAATPVGSVVPCPEGLPSPGAPFVPVNTGPNSTSTKIDWDPATGIPTCTVVLSNNPATPPGTVVSCPEGLRSPDSPMPIVNDGPNSTSTQIDWNRVTGVPTCTVVISNNPATPPGTVVSCPEGLPRPTGTTPDSGASAPRISTPVTLAGVRTGSDILSILRIANADGIAGTATVAIVDPDSGNILARWTSAALPAHAGLQSSVATIIGEAVLESAVSALPAVVNLQVSASFAGTVQHLVFNPHVGVATNASGCAGGTQSRLGYVPVDNAQVTSLIWLVNSGEIAVRATILFRDAATGTPLGIWMSPNIAGGGAGNFTLKSMLEVANVPAGPTAVVLDTNTLADGLRLELTQASTVTGQTADQTAACAL